MNSRAQISPGTLAADLNAAQSPNYRSEHILGNGIKFAFPTVQVAGEAEAVTAAVAQRALELTQPAAA